MSVGVSVKTAPKKISIVSPRHIASASAESSADVTGTTNWRVLYFPLDRTGTILNHGCYTIHLYYYTGRVLHHTSPLLHHTFVLLHGCYTIHLHCYASATPLYISTATLP